MAFKRGVAPLVFSIVTTFVLAGCGGGGGSSPVAAPPSALPTASATPHPTASPSPGNPTPKPSPSGAATPTATPRSSASPTATPTQSPTAAPSQSPTAAPTQSPTSAPTQSPAYSDWSQYGYDLSRSGYNPRETTVGTANIGSLRQIWKFATGSTIDAQPILASAITTPSGVHDLILVGAENGAFHAIDATSGQAVWTQSLGSHTTGCGDLPGGVFGTTGSAAFDRATGRVYVADGNNTVWALNVSNGQPVWHVGLPQSVAQNHVYSGVAFNPANGLLYVSVASYCDTSPWQGGITAISTASGSIGSTFYPSSTMFGGTGSGGGIWGPVSASIDPATNDVFIATGNADPTSQPGAYNQGIVRLSADLSRVVSSAVLLIGGDSDYGATPLIFTPAGCPPQVVAQNKIGTLEQDPRDSIGLPNQAELHIAPPNANGNGDFIGIPAFSPATNLVYVGSYATLAPFSQGMNALSVDANCHLQRQWSTYVNTNPQNEGDNVPVSPPTVANGVVYFGTGVGNAVFAFDAQSGAQLWNSGTLGGPIFAAPILDRNLYAASWDGNVYAFGVDTEAATSRLRRPAQPHPVLRTH